MKHALKTLLLLAAAAGFFAAPGCSGGSHDGPACPVKDSLSRKFFTLSDIHFNPYADPTIVRQLAKADVGQWESIFESSAVKNFGTYQQDADFQLMKSAFAALHTTQANPDFILITGDFLAHNFVSNFTQYTGSSNTDSLHLFIDKTIQFIALELRKSFPKVPVYPVLGNNDDYCGDYMIQPDSKFLGMFAQTWAPFLDDAKLENNMLQSFPKGGYYSAALPGDASHMVIGLNTIFFSPKDTSTCQPPDTSAGTTELRWLRQTLAGCAAKKQKAWLTCHIPPGTDVYSSTRPSSNCADHIKTMWKPQYSAAFIALLEEYKDVIAGGFAGHTHMDDFRIVDNAAGNPGTFFHINPAISPIFGNNPGFQQFSYDPQTLALNDYTTYAFSGVENEAAAAWTAEYTFGKTYAQQGVNAQSLGAVWNAMSTDTTIRNDYVRYYGVGRLQAEAAPWEPYWCGIRRLTGPAFASCYCK